MKPFNKERAIAGDPVITRSGKKVTELKFFNEPDVCGDSIVAKIDNQIFSFQGNGKFFPSIDVDDMERGLDLFMAPEKIKGWVAISKAKSYSGVHLVTNFYIDKSKIDINDESKWTFHEIEIEV